MVSPNLPPDAGHPADAEQTTNSASTAGIITNQAPDPDQNASGNPETVTQADLAGSDGAGIRGDYGDASQTTGLEGGDQQPADTEGATDTELTGS